MPDQGAGATPAAAAGATPEGTKPAAAPATGTQASPPAPPSDPEFPEGLGDAGKRAIQSERDARREAERARADAERERDELKARTQTDSEKALEQARKEGAGAERTRTDAIVRRAEVKAALGAAGIRASVLDLAVGASEFASLKVTDDGNVEGLEAAVAKFKGSRADLFGTARPNDVGQGPQTPAGSAGGMDAYIRRAAGRG